MLREQAGISNQMIPRRMKLILIESLANLIISNSIDFVRIYINFTRLKTLTT